MIATILTVLIHAIVFGLQLILALLLTRRWDREVRAKQIAAEVAERLDSKLSRKIYPASLRYDEELHRFAVLTDDGWKTYSSLED